MPKTLKKRIMHVLVRFPLVLNLIYRIVRFFVNKHAVGVQGVILDHQGRVLMVEHAFHVEHPWGLPGGWIDRNESPTETLIREFQEELSIRIEIIKILQAHQVDYDHNHIDIAYLCSTQDAVDELSFELLSYRWIEKSEVDTLPLDRFTRISIDLAYAHQSETVIFDPDLSPK